MNHSDENDSLPNNIPDYSIVIPVYYNEDTLNTIYEQIHAEIVDKNPDKSYEIIFIDDGSGDNSLSVLKQLQEEDSKHVKVIKLTRNFGQPSARLAGLRYASGKCVISMAADGQEPPSLAHEMINSHFNDGYEVVIAARQGRDESFFRVITSKIFYKLMQSLCFKEMPIGGFSYVLLGRKALDTLLQNQESHPFFQGQILWMGYEIKFIHFRRPARYSGVSRWTFGKKITLLMDGLLSYSFLPIRLMSFTGIFASSIGLILAVLILIRRILFETTVQGWTGLMLVILIIGGLQMMMLGILGEYMWRTLAQTRNRDQYVIDKIYKK